MRLVLFFILISYPTWFSQIVNQTEIDTTRIHTIFTNYSCRSSFSEFYCLLFFLFLVSLRLYIGVLSSWWCHAASRVFVVSKRLRHLGVLSSWWCHAASRVFVVSERLRHIEHGSVSSFTHNTTFSALLRAIDGAETQCSSCSSTASSAVSTTLCIARRQKVPLTAIQYCPSHVFYVITDILLLICC